MYHTIPFQLIKIRKGSTWHLLELQIMLPRVATQVKWLNTHWGAPPVGNRNIITEPSFLLLMLRRVQIWTRRKSAITTHWETALTIMLSSAKTSGWCAGWNAVLSVHITCQLKIHYNDLYFSSGRFYHTDCGTKQLKTATFGKKGI